MNIPFSLYRILLFLLVLLPIYEDSPFSKYLGAAGYTIIMPLSLILIVLYVLFTQKLPNNQLLNGLVKLCGFMTIVSYIAIIVWVGIGEPIIVVSEYLPYKAFKVALQYFSYPAYVALVLICSRKTGTRYIGKDAFFTLIILTLICLVEKQQSPYAFEGLHFSGVFPYWRVRLLTIESSWTAMMIYVYSAISIYWSKAYNKRFAFIVTILCCGILLLASGSKTLMVSIGITIIIYALIALRKINWKTIISMIAASIMMCLFAYFVLPTLLASFQSDITDYTSAATRIYSSAIGLLIGIVFPFGLGGAVSLGVYQDALWEFLPTFQSLPIPFNTSEIVSLASSTTGQALTVKSGILNANMYWGILGTIYLLHNFSKVSSNIKKENVLNHDFLRTTFCTAVILLFGANIMFDFWLLYSFLLCLGEECRSKG